MQEEPVPANWLDKNVQALTKYSTMLRGRYESIKPWLRPHATESYEKLEENVIQEGGALEKQTIPQQELRWSIDRNFHYVVPKIFMDNGDNDSNPLEVLKFLFEWMADWEDWKD